MVISTISFQVLADEGHNHGSVRPDGRFTPNTQGAVFPPQPRDVTDVVVYLPVIQAGETAQLRGASVAGAANIQAAQAAENNADVQALLGDRYSLLQSVRVRDKTRKSRNTFRVEYFSRSENRTVVATSVDGAITEISSYAASERQPALGEEEKAMAIDIARRYWVERDDSQVEGLTGYAIQTFQPDGSPYPTRVAYVSFHSQSPEPPELITWVDLSEEQVLSAEVER
ncbi:MAG: hypothetical protein AB8B64_17800 [Granulosicoccus sp.]